MADWDGDGHMDLIYSSLVVPKSGQGSVFWCRNLADAGEPRFDAPEALVWSGLATQAISPELGLERVMGGSITAVPTDWDGDGDLDLVVTDTVRMVQPKAGLSAEQKKRLKEVQVGTFLSSSLAHRLDPGGKLQRVCSDFESIRGFLALTATTSLLDRGFYKATRWTFCLAPRKLSTIMKKIKASTIVPVILISLLGGVQAQELAPDDASIVDSLGAWFKDAEGTFDEETGIWADSSGKDNHAEPVGEVNVAGPVTFIGPTLGMISGGAFSDDDVSSVHFANDVDDLLVSPDLNADAGLTDLTIFVVYNANFLASNPNLTRAVGFGSISATQANAGNHFNLAGDPSVRKDNGQLGSGTYTEAFPIETTFIRTARMSATAVDEWFNTDGTLNNVLNLTGVSYTTSSDDFFLGDIRCGFTSTPGFPATAMSDFDIIQTIAYNAALTDEQIAGVNEWLSNNIGSSGPGGELEITGIEVDTAADSAMITWASKPGKTYAVDSSDDLNNWVELDDGVSSGGASTSFTELDLGGATKRFYRVREL